MEYCITFVLRMSTNKFVFVVCGAKEHVDTLHFSLRYLKRFSKNEIIVVTDTSRNEVPVVWSNLTDVNVPEHLNNHQASIYLKTGLHKFLPKGFTYCYLDTDVIAMSGECDDVFKHKQGPITFAADHCRLPAFSPNAVRCDCAIQNKKDIAALEQLMEKYDPARKLLDPGMERKKRELIKKFEIIKQNKFSYLLLSMRFLATLNKFKLDEDTFFDRRQKLWVDKEGRAIISGAGNMFKDIEKNSHWRWNKITRRWYGPDGRDVFNLTCLHLADYIFNRFGIEVKDKNFQHWNGGVFVFDDNSHPFMEAWFNKTMQIFTWPEWMTRDQGTLIATVWEFGLQKNPVLPSKFNFIADYTSQRVMMDEDGNFTDNAFKTKLRPALIHVYHNFGMKGWDMWDYIEQLGEQHSVAS